MMRSIKLSAAVFASILSVSSCNDEGDTPLPEKGSNSLIALTNEPAGENCPFGGIFIQTGVDENNNGTLEIDEVGATAFVCNGQDGSDGTDGLSAAVNATTLEPGATCSNGGTQIDLGIDLDGNGVLDAEEITATTVICNGIDGSNGITSRIDITEEAPGNNCEVGGVKIEMGLDQNANGLLDADEIENTSYICAGIDGMDSPAMGNVLVVSEIEPAGVNCETGGYKVSVGYDLNGNDILEALEITSFVYLCGDLQPSVSLGKTYLVLSGDLTQAEANDIISRDFGTNTQFVYIQNTSRLKKVDLPILEQLVELRVTDNDSLESLSFPDLTTVVNELEIKDNSLLKLINLPLLEKALSLSLLEISGTDLDTISIPNLNLSEDQRIFVLSDTAAFIDLSSIQMGTIELTGNNLDLSLSNTTDQLGLRISDFDINNNDPLVLENTGFRSLEVSSTRSVELPNLVQVLEEVSLTLNNQSNPPTFSFPALVSAGEISLNGNITGISFPVLTEGEIELQLNSLGGQTANISVPELISGGITSFTNIDVGDLLLPKFETGLIQFEAGAKIDSLSLPEFTSGSIFLSNVENLIALELPKIQNIEGLSIVNTDIETMDISNADSMYYFIFVVTNAKLSTFQVPEQAVITGLEDNLNELDWYFYSNAFSSEEVNDILALVAGNSEVQGGILSLEQDSAAPPTGQGITDKETLIDRGVIVSTD